MVCSSWSSVVGCLFLPPLAPLLKEGLPAFGPPRDGFGLLLGLLDGGEQGAGERLHGQSIGAEDLDEFAELDGLLRLDLLGFVHEGLKFCIEVAWFTGHRTGSQIMSGLTSA